jgi:hypothetical protein
MGRWSCGKDGLAILADPISKSVRPIRLTCLAVEMSRLTRLSHGEDGLVVKMACDSSRSHFKVRWAHSAHLSRSGGEPFGSLVV